MNNRFQISNFKFTLFIFLILLTSSLSARRYNPFVWTTYTEFSPVYSIAINTDEVYLGTNGGILRYNRIKNEWDPPVTKSNEFPGNKAEIVAIDRIFNKLWVVSDNSIAIYIPQISFWERKIPFISLPATSITSIGFTQSQIFIECNSGTYFSQRSSYVWQRWTGTLPQNIEWFGEKGKASIRDYPFLTPYYVTDEYFNRYEYTAIAIDKKNIWLGTDGYGIFKENIYTWNGIHYIEGLANNRVDAIFRDGNSFWCGGMKGSGKGITYINFRTGEGKYYRSEDIIRLNSDEVYAITGNNKMVWFGTVSGLACYEKGKNKWKTYSMFDGLPGNDVISLILKADTLFIGTNEGLALLFPKSKHIENIEPFDNISINAFGLYKNHLLIATGMGVFIKKDKKFETITDPDGDFSFGVAAIFVDSNAIWFGTIRKGVDVYYPDSSKWEEYLYPTTISGEHVFVISGNKDYIWIGTDNGVTRYNKKLKMWKSFKENDGLANNEIRSIYVGKDYVWFGTKDGLTRFKYTDPSVPP